MRITRMRGVQAAGLGAALTLGLAACGGGGAGRPAAAGGTGSTPRAQLAAAYTTSVRARTFDFTWQTTVGAGGGVAGAGTVRRLTGSGEGDLSTRALAMTMTLPGNTSLRLVEDRGVAYIEVPPAIRSKIPGGRPWIAVDINAVLTKTLGSTFSQLTSGSGGGNPSQLLSYLQGVSDSVTRAGTTTIDGTPATEYKAEVDLNKVAATAKTPGAAAAIRREERMLHGSTLAFDAWIAADHTVRRISTSVPLAAAGAGGKTQVVTTTVTYSHYGAPVHIAPPPAGSVTNLTPSLSGGATAPS